MPATVRFLDPEWPLTRSSENRSGSTPDTQAEYPLISSHVAEYGPAAEKVALLSSAAHARSKRFPPYCR